MVFDAKLAPPRPASLNPAQPTPVAAVQLPKIEPALSHPFTIYTAAPGYFDADLLAALAAARRQPVLWLRLDPYDCDPATLLLSLIAAGRRRRPGFGGSILALLRSHPGPIEGWPPLYEHLAEALVNHFPPGTLLVIENLHLLNQAPPTLQLLGLHLLPALRMQFHTVLVSHRRLPPASFPGDACWQSVQDLEITAEAGLRLMEEAESGLHPRAARRIYHLLRGRAVAMTGVLAACQMLGPQAVSTAAARSRDVNQFLTRLARESLAAAGADELQSLALALQLEYAHPDLIVNGSNVSDTSGGVVITVPWMQPLEGDWQRLRGFWKQPIQKVLSAILMDPRPALYHAAAVLTQGKNEALAVQLYLDLGDHAMATQVLNGCLGELMDLGQWESAARLLGQLPPEDLRNWPLLLHFQGELAAVRGEVASARRAFRQAAKQFLHLEETSGACRSLLAESWLLGWQGEAEQAETCAWSAYHLAAGHGLEEEQGLAVWQLACLAAAGGEPGSAVQYLDEASRHWTIPQAAETFCRLETLLRDQQRLQERLAAAHAEVEAAEHSLEQNARLLQDLLSTGTCQAEVLQVRGWARTPLNFKLSPRVVHPNQSPAEASGRLRGLFLGGLEKVRTWLPWQSRTRGSVDDESWHFLPLLTWLQEAGRSDNRPGPDATAEAGPGDRDDTQEEGPAVDPGAGTEKAEEEQKVHNPQPRREKKRRRQAESQVRKPGEKDKVLPALAIYCLGPFRVYQKERLVEAWSSRKALSILKYLVAQPGVPIPKEVLMELFWPGTDPEASRRNLHQAIYVLRQALKVQGSDLQHIVFDQDCYSLNPKLDIWIDHVEFERRYLDGQQLEKNGKLEQAVVEYGIAEGLYRDNFLAEDLYEDWPVPRRNYLWQAYLHAAYRTGDSRLERGDYSTAILVYQRILEKDASQEKAHQQLMHCFLRQGLRHMAIRQYQLCRQILKTDLDVPPSAETEALYRQALQA